MWPFTRKQKRFADAIMQIGGPEDWLTLSQCYSNIFISGQVGSGKTTGPGANLALGLLAHPSRPGALWLCQKPDEAQRVIGYCNLVNRSGDVIHVRLGGEHSINLLDHTLSGPGGVEEARLLMAVTMEAANRNRARNSSEPYWEDSAQRWLGYAMTLIKMAGLVCGYKEVMDFIQSCPNSPEQLMDAEWNESSFSAACVNAATEKYRGTPIFEMAANWFADEMPTLSEKTKSVILSVIVNILDKFLSSKFYGLIAGANTFTPEFAINDGKIVIWDLPGTTFGPAATWTAISIKLQFQKALMRRDLSNPRPFLMFADEAANFLIPEQDAMFLSQSRQFKVICCNIVQNIPLCTTALGSNEAAKHQAYAWISNHALHIIAAQTEPETCELYSKMAGETRETLYGGSGGGHFQYDLMADIMGQQVGNANVSWNQQIRPSLPPHFFSTQLKKGGCESGMVVEAVVMQSGRIFSNRKSFIKGAWKQVS